MGLFRTSVVADDVPLLISSGALKKLAAVLDLANNQYTFRRLHGTTDVINTASGHIGFNILQPELFEVDVLMSWDWQGFINEGTEVSLQDKGGVQQGSLQGSLEQRTLNPSSCVDMSCGHTSMDPQPASIPDRKQELVDSSDDHGREAPCSEDQGRVHRSFVAFDEADCRTDEGGEPREAAIDLPCDEAEASEEDAPPNWKRFSKANLIELYVNQAMPWYGLGPERTEYAGWGKGRLILELEHYDIDITEAGVIHTETVEEAPTCVRRGVYMMKRTNRLDHRGFWGCVMFPTRRETLALDYNGIPAAVAQDQERQRAEMARQSRGSGNGSKIKLVDGGEDMNGEVLTRAVAAKVPEDDAASWEQVTTTHGPKEIKLSEAEVQVIKDMRKNQ